MASLYIYMNGREVGEYIQRKSGAQEFVYHDSWLALREAIPLSLTLPLTAKRHKGAVVYNFFDNLLPDSLDIRNRIQARFGAASNQAYDLLAHIGRDCLGAIQLLPERTELNVKKIEGQPLTEQAIAEELRNYKALPLGMSGDEDFRISLAGAQEKTALLWHQNQWHRPQGTTPTTHILKLPIGHISHQNIDLRDSVENEWLCLQLLRAFDLPVPKCEIARFEDTKALVVERFDRTLAKDGTWLIRHPVEDMCQATGTAAALKYENDGGPGIAAIMDLLTGALQPEADRHQFMLRVFLFWLLGAIDGHAKNFSLFLKAGGRFQLTPVYDVISAYPLVAKRQLEEPKLRMAMAIRGKNKHYRWQEILPRHWLEQAGQVRFAQSAMQAIMDEALERLDAVIESVAGQLPAGFPAEIAEPIFDGLLRAARNLAEH